jgi:hypothetical protein
MSATHTPGPWLADRFPGDRWEVWTEGKGDANPAPIGSACGCAASFPEADARLIALAPEMLQFVKDACAEMDSASALRMFGETILARAGVR